MNIYLSKFAPGILPKVGSYRISGDDLLKVLNYNPRSGINGEVFFFYEGLRENHDELAQILKQTYYAGAAKLPNFS